MSTATVDPTRKHLEELDALLQRMLSLPVGASESGAAPTSAPRAPSAPTPAVGPATVYSYTGMSSPMQVTFSLPEPPAGSAPPAQRPAALQQPSPPAPPQNASQPNWTVPLPGVASGPSVLSWSNGFEKVATKREAPPQPPPPPKPQPSESNRLAPEPQQRLQIQSFSAPQAQAMAQNVALPPNAQTDVSTAAPMPVVLWPAAAIDWLFGNMLAGFGPVGRWFGKGSGKIFFGLAGLLMAGAAIAWAVMDYFGWSW